MKRFLFIPVLLACANVHADGLVIDKIYHPYVDALERELEYRAFVPDRQATQPTPAQLHMVSLGTAIGSRLFAEVYTIGEKARGGGFATTAWEAEFKWQLTEQGEYWADWGLLFEYENERRRDAEEFSVALLAEKEWNRWSGAANLHVINEWGGSVVNEIETALALQLRHRYAQAFEPGIEFYAGQDARGIGPVVQGTVRTGLRKSLHWEAGAIAGLGDDSPDMTWRFLFEFEF
ncbi:MAG: hypothetical protein SV422_03065 [Pseudomonadota bacterium]|nr:hypothetical protein [Pseudomonadota bacterium]